MPAVITVTLNPVIDLIYHVPPYEKGDTVRAHRFEQAPAGKGINVSITLACLGEPSTVLMLGGSQDRPLYQALCDRHGIALAQLDAWPWVRRHCTMLEQQGNTTTHIQVRGDEPDPQAIKDLITLLERTLSAEDVLILAGSIPPGVDEAIYGRLIALGKAAGAWTVLDSHSAPLRYGLEAGPALLKINHHEAMQYCGVEEGRLTDAALLTALEERAQTPMTVITLGGRGVMGSDGNQRLRLWIDLQPEEVRDTVGCGDAMLAGMVSVLLNGGHFEAMLREGIACATAAATQTGPGQVAIETIQAMRPRASMEPVAD